MDSRSLIDELERRRRERDFESSKLLNETDEVLSSLFHTRAQVYEQSTGDYQELDNDVQLDDAPVINETFQRETLKVNDLTVERPVSIPIQFPTEEPEEPPVIPVQQSHTLQQRRSRAPIVSLIDSLSASIRNSPEARQFKKQVKLEFYCKDGDKESPVSSQQEDNLIQKYKSGHYEGVEPKLGFAKLKVDRSDLAVSYLKDREEEKALGFSRERIRNSKITENFELKDHTYESRKMPSIEKPHKYRNVFLQSNAVVQSTDKSNIFLSKVHASKLRESIPVVKKQTQMVSEEDGFEIRVPQSFAFKNKRQVRGQSHIDFDIPDVDL